MTSDGNNISDFPENQLTKFPAGMIVVGKEVPVWHTVPLRALQTPGLQIASRARVIITAQRAQASSPYNPNALFAVSRSMRAVKLCTYKILQFLTGGAG